MEQNLPIEHKNRRVLLEADSYQQIFHGCWNAIIAASVNGIHVIDASLIGQYFNIDKLEMAAFSMASSSPNSRRIHRYDFN